VILHGIIIPYFETRWRRYSVPALIFIDCGCMGFRLPLQEPFKVGLGAADQNLNRMLLRMECERLRRSDGSDVGQVWAKRDEEESAQNQPAFGLLWKHEDDLGNGEEGRYDR
jgi:hypothetical protein